MDDSSHICNTPSQRAGGCDGWYHLILSPSSLPLFHVQGPACHNCGLCVGQKGKKGEAGEKGKGVALETKQV